MAARASTTTTMMVRGAFVALVLAMFAVAATHAQDGPEELRFAVMLDRSVAEDGIEAVVQTSCRTTDPVEAATMPRLGCQEEANAMCASMGDECGGFVIEPVIKADGSSDMSGFAIKIFKAGASQDPSLLIDVEGATLFERRDVATSSEDFMDFLAELNKEGLADVIDELISKHPRIQELERGIEGKMARVNSATVMPNGMLRYPTRNSRWSSFNENEAAKEIAAFKAAIIDEVVDTMSQQKFGFSPKPKISCSLGSFRGGRVSYAQYTAPTLPTYKPKKCEPGLFTPKICSCTPPTYTPGFCVGGFYIPSRKPSYYPPLYIPKFYSPGTCSVDYIEIEKH